MRGTGALAAALVPVVFGVPVMAAAAGPPAESFVRGLVQSGDASGIWTLRRCGDSVDLPIKDKTPGDALTIGVAEVKRVMQDPRRPVLVEFQGTVSSGQAVAKRLWRVLGYVDECAKVPGNVAVDAKLWASGNEPGWRLIVRGKIATLTRLGRERLEFDAAAFASQGPVRRYQAQSGSTQLAIEIDEEVCLDTMAEAAYGARVTATVREGRSAQSLKGCAARY